MSKRSKWHWQDEHFDIKIIRYRGKRLSPRRKERDVWLIEKTPLIPWQVDHTTAPTTSGTMWYMNIED